MKPYVCPKCDGKKRIVFPENVIGLSFTVCPLCDGNGFIMAPEPSEPILKAEDPKGANANMKFTGFEFVPDHEPIR